MPVAFSNFMLSLRLSECLYRLRFDVEWCNQDMTNDMLVVSRDERFVTSEIVVRFQPLIILIQQVDL